MNTNQPRKVSPFLIYVCMAGFGLFANFAYFVFAMPVKSIVFRVVFSGVLSVVVTAVTVSIFALFYSGLVMKMLRAVGNAISDLVHSIIRPIVLKRMGVPEEVALTIGRTRGVLNLKTLQDLRLAAGTSGKAFYTGVIAYCMSLGMRMTFREEAIEQREVALRLAENIPDQRQERDDALRRQLEGLRQTEESFRSSNRRAHIQLDEQEQMATATAIELGSLLGETEGLAGSEVSNTAH